MPKIPKIQATFIAPMLAKACRYAATKLRVDIFSRRGNRFTKRYPSIAAAFERLAPDTVIDGEVVCLDERGRTGKADRRAKGYLEIGPILGIVATLAVILNINGHPK